MKLSEAMRIGTMQVHATRCGSNMIFNRVVGQPPCAACALGTVALVAGLPTGMGELLWWTRAMCGDGPLVDAFPILVISVANPEIGDVYRMSCVINDLFESWRWSREQIGDWIQTIEAQQGHVAEPSPALVSA